MDDQTSTTEGETNIFSKSRHSWNHQVRSPQADLFTHFQKLIFDMKLHYLLPLMPVLAVTASPLVDIAAEGNFLAFYLYPFLLIFQSHRN